MGGVEIAGYEPLVNDVKELIHKKQYHVLKIMNTETINLYWEIGEEIYRQQEINGWGKSIVKILSKELQKEFPGAKGYSSANLWRMRNFYLSYRNSEKLAPLVREISWSNNIVIMEKCKDDLQREFYIQMAKRYGWTKRILANFIEAQTYEKYLLNQTNFDLTLPEERRAQAKLAVKDEYTFDFAELSPGSYRKDDPIGRLMRDFTCKDAKDIHYQELAEGVRHFKEEKGGREVMCQAVKEYANEVAKRAAVETAIRTAIKYGIEKERIIPDINEEFGISGAEAEKLYEAYAQDTGRN